MSRPSEEVRVDFDDERGRAWSWSGPAATERTWCAPQAVKVEVRPSAWGPPMWAIAIDGSDTAEFDSRTEAVAVGRELAVRLGAKLVLHAEEGGA